MKIRIAGNVKVPVFPGGKALSTWADFIDPAQGVEPGDRLLYEQREPKVGELMLLRKAQDARDVPQRFLRQRQPEDAIVGGHGTMGQFPTLVGIVTHLFRDYKHKGDPYAAN